MYVELISLTQEFPLDQVNLVFITDINNVTNVSFSLPLLYQSAERNSLFTIGVANTTDLSTILPSDVKNYHVPMCNNF